MATARVRHSNSRPTRRARAQMFAMYGDLCHLCGHPGADSADHLVPISVAPHQPVSPHGMRPAHGRPCPTCGRRCNAERGTSELLVEPLATSEDW